MRIIAGEWRRRLLRAPSGEATRPTADRTRETLFAMLTSRLGSFEGLTVADLFAGSGALGLEALSRGAASCVFVEHEAEALRALRANIAALQAHAQATVEARSVMQLGPARQACDLLLLDPPYGSGAGAAALLVMGFVYGPLGGWMPALFPVTVRYTAISIAFNVGGVLGGAVAPIIAQMLSAAGGTALVGLLLSVAGMVTGFGVIVGKASAAE